MGQFDEQGYVHILGRGKDLIISGGLNVYPKQVEDALDSLEFIKESAVIGVPHSDFGEVAVAVCIPADWKSDLTRLEANVLKEVKQELSSYKVPKKVIFVEELPRNSMGKIQKKDLREKYKNLFH
uniref:AMP-binding enzyme C-terminal domain-containing protein n=1 Tax=Acrobeloides nanus TaxID=290746 RepID=A0A914DP71_9BILA